MYLQSLQLQDVKCFKEISLRFQTTLQTGDRQSNWNVILGNNGDGKTTLLQAIAACMMDATTAGRLLKLDNWVSTGQSVARLTATLTQETHDKQRGRIPQDKKLSRTVQHLIINAGQEIELEDAEISSLFFSTATILEPTPDYRASFGTDYEKLIEDIDFLKRNAFQRHLKSGWVSCGYGAFRRISGFSSQTALIDDQLQKRFLTLFEEGAALYDCESWLKELDRKATKSQQNSPQRRTLAEVKQLIVQLLPGVDEIRLEDEVKFMWRGDKVNLSQLSDGYRSMFALAVDLLRWLELLRPPQVKRLNEVGGVVLIDEIDAHLHPKWQREAGFLLTKIFPNLQFIVATHSPFVAMAAGEGALTLLEKEGDQVYANQDVPYIRGWAIDQVLTQLFGLVSLRDPETSQKLERYETLRLARRRPGQLSPAEAQELATLEAELNTLLAGAPDSPQQKEMAADLAFFTAALKKKNGAPDA